MVQTVLRRLLRHRNVLFALLAIASIVLLVLCYRLSPGEWPTHSNREDDAAVGVRLLSDRLLVADVPEKRNFRFRGRENGDDDVGRDEAIASPVPRDASGDLDPLVRVPQKKKKLLILIHIYKEARLLKLKETWLGTLDEMGLLGAVVDIITFSSTFRNVDIYVEPPAKVGGMKGCPTCKPNEMNRRKMKVVWTEVAGKLGGAYDWFYKIDDDVYVFVDNLMAFVELQDSEKIEEPKFLGYRWKSEDQNDRWHKRPPGLIWPSGGPGFLVNAPALAVFKENVLDLTREFPIVHPMAKSSSSDDLLFGYYMQYHCDIELQPYNEVFFIEEPDAFMVRLYLGVLKWGWKPSSFNVDHIAFHHVRDLDRMVLPTKKKVPGVLFQLLSFDHARHDPICRFRAFDRVVFSTVHAIEDYAVEERTSRTGNHNAYDYFHSYEDDYFRRLRRYFNFFKLDVPTKRVILSYLFLHLYGGFVLLDDSLSCNADFLQRLKEAADVCVSSGKEMFIVVLGSEVVAMGGVPYSYAAFTLFKDLHFLEKVNLQTCGRVEFVWSVMDRRQAERIGERVEIIAGEDWV